MVLELEVELMATDIKRQTETEFLIQFGLSYYKLHTEKGLLFLKEMWRMTPKLI